MPPTKQPLNRHEVLKAIGIFSALCLLWPFVPLLSLVGTLFLPMPMIYYRIKLGRQAGALILMAGMVLQWLVAAPSPLESVYFLGLVGLGYLLGESFEAGDTLEHAVLKGLAAVVGAGGILLILANLVSKPSLLEQVRQALSLWAELVFEGLQEQGVAVPTSEESMLAKNQMVAWGMRTIPGQILGSLIMAAWASTLVARTILTNRGLPFPQGQPLNRWRAPEYLVWGIILMGICLLIPAREARIIGVNGLMILAPIYFFQGMAIVTFYLFKKGVPRPFRIFLYILIAIQPFAWLIVFLAGLFDVWFNLRRLEVNNHPNDQLAT